MSKVSVILLAGGIGKRTGRDIPKQHLMLHGKPIIMHTLERLDTIENVGEIIVTCPAEFIKETENIIARYNIEKDLKCIEGGATRHESVFKGLVETRYPSILIHEAARPFVSTEEFSNMINSASENVTYAINIPFTVLQGTDKITGILEREKLLNIQLPQKFDREDLLLCHKKAASEGLAFTEDASLFFHYLHKDVAVMKGSEFNLKVTTPLDLIVGEQIYLERFTDRKSR